MPHFLELTRIKCLLIKFIIYFSDNGITAFPDDMFRDMPSLRTLELERNNIKTLSESSWGLIIEELSRVYLEGKQYVLL